MGYERVSNIVATGTYIPPKPKKQYKVIIVGTFQKTQIVTLVDDFNKETDSVEDCIETVIKDDWHQTIRASFIEEL